MHLRELSDVLAAPGPFVTVHVGAESAVEQAADRYDLAWKAVLQRLEQEGVPAPVREAIAGAQGAHDEGEGRLVVASLPEARVLLAEPVSTRPARRGSTSNAAASRTPSSGTNSIPIPRSVD